jgi:transposase
MCAYSIDLRERVVAALDRGMPRQEVVTTFAVSLATIKRWVAKQRTDGSLVPGRPPGRTPHLGDAELAVLRTRLEAAPDATLDEHTAWWNHHHPERPVARATIDRAITRLGWSRKKRRFVPANGTKRPEPHSKHAF